MLHRFLPSLLVLACSLAASAGACRTYTRQLAPGVTLTQTITIRDGAAHPERIVNVLRIDPRVPGVRMEAVLGQGRVYGGDKLKGRENASASARRLGALAVVNAGYFWQSGDPLGLHISGGELVSDPYPGRAVFGLLGNGSPVFDQLDFEGSASLPDGRTFPIRGINRPYGRNELVLFTPRFGDCSYPVPDATCLVLKCPAGLTVGTPVTGTVDDLRIAPGGLPLAEGSLVIAGTGSAAEFLQSAARGTEMTINCRLKSRSGSNWDNVQEAVGGGPWLVRRGRVYVDAETQGIKPDISRGHNARTAVGASATGVLFLVTAGGWRRSGGYTLQGMAELMRSLGCVSAVNLDGGGSSTLSNALGVINLPTDVNERYVADALAVYGDEAAGSPVFTRRTDLASRSGDSRAPDPASCEPTSPADALSIIPPDEPVTAGAAALFRFVGPDGEPYPELAEKAVWSVTSGMGFIDQSGRLYAEQPAKGKVSVSAAGLSASLPVEILPTPVESLEGIFTADPSGAANRRLLTVRVFLGGRPCAGRTVNASVTGGAADQPGGVTDASGSFSTGITLDEPPSNLSARVEVAPSQAGGVPSRISIRE